MLMNDYQRMANEFIYDGDEDKLTFAFLALGLGGEAGEIAEKAKKMYRDQQVSIQTYPYQLSSQQKLDIALELGDLLWYITIFADRLGYTLSEIGMLNYDKLKSRETRGTLSGSGDNR